MVDDTPDGFLDEFFAPSHYETLGIEIPTVADGHAEGRLPFDESISASPGESVSNGGAIASLATPSVTGGQFHERLPADPDGRPPRRLSDPRRPGT
jgi:hypothetical protein